MNDIFNLIDKNQNISLQAIGLLLLLIEPNASFHFATRDAFFKYFRLKNQHHCEKYFSELVDIGIVNRVVVGDKQKYCVLKKIKFEVPLSSSKKNINTCFNEQIHFIHKGFCGKVTWLFKECEKNIDVMRKEDLQYFFSMFEGMTTKQYVDFFNSISKTKIYSLKYLNKIAETVKTKTEVKTYSKDLFWDKEKEEANFAVKVASGEALTRQKYKTLLKQNKIEDLRAYYEKGKKLLDTNPYTDYEWL